ncbi:MAG: SLC13 family permease [Kofleriaceae bacterium]
MVGALVVFCLTYLVIASRQLHWIGLDRPAGAIVGATAMVLVGGLPMDRAIAAIDMHVVVLLFGVLLIAAYLAEARFFKFTAYHVLVRARSARSLLFGLTFVVGGLSALLLNDTVCVLLTPLVVSVVVEARLPALPYLLALASAANVGGLVSFSGNPQNMIVGAAAQDTIGFLPYLVFTLPAGIACLAANAAIIAWLFRKELPTEPLAQRSPPKPALDKPLAIKGLTALAAFAVLAACGVSLAGAAMIAASGLMVVAGIGHAAPRPKKAFALVDWQLLVFFAGLFIVVAGVAHAGVLDEIFGYVAPLVARGDIWGDLAFLAFIVVISNLVSNVPLVLVAVAWVPQMPDPAWGFVMLAVGSTVAGNLTLFGSVANIIVMEGAGPRGEISFVRFLRYGSVITLVDLVVVFSILYAERALGLLAAVT